MNKYPHLIILACLLPLTLLAQAPLHFSYQAIVRNSAGYALDNQTVGIAISILQGSSEGISLYSETHTILSDKNGLVSTEIGNGANTQGELASIDWQNGPFFIKTDIDPLGGTDYTLSGTTQMQSVPFAQFANRSDTITGHISFSQINDFKNYSIRNSGMLNALDYDIKGDGVNDDTQAIIALFDSAKGQAIFFPPGQYLVDGSTISAEKVQLYGVCPQYVDSTLENGTIFRGKLSFTGKNVMIKNIGINLHGMTADDGLRVTPDMNTGHYCEIHHVITVGANTASPFHSFLVEGFDHVNISNIEVRDAYMGVIMKVKGGILHNIRSYNVAKEALFLKSDNAFGNCNDLMVDKVYVENTSPGQSVGVKVLSDGAQFENLNLSNIFVRRGFIGIAIISSGGNGIAVNNINIQNVKLDWPILYGIYLEANKGFIYSTNINNVDATNFKNLLTTVGTVKYLNVNNVNGNALSNLDITLKEKVINIGAETKKTQLSNITMLMDYNENNSLAVWYQNSSSENRIVNHNLRLRGGIPQSGSSTTSITGTGNSLAPVLSTITNSSLLTIIPDAEGTEVNAIAIFPDDNYTSELFPIGYELILRNNSNYDLTIKNNYAGKIINPDLEDFTLKAQSLASYVFSGSVWNKKD